MPETDLYYDLEMLKNSWRILSLTRSIRLAQFAFHCIHWSAGYGRVHLFAVDSQGIRLQIIRGVTIPDGNSQHARLQNFSMFSARAPTRTENREKSCSIFRISKTVNYDIYH